MNKTVNKKGIATTIAVFVIFVAALALVFAFISFDSSIKKEVESMGKPVQDAEFIENYVVQESALIAQESIKKGGDIKSNFIEIAGKRDFEIEDFGNFFGKIRNSEFEFEKKDEGYVLEFKEIFISTKTGENSVKRNFDFSAKFGEAGELKELSKIYKEQNA
jgi:hypothetical protein